MKIQHVSYEQRIRELALSFPETYEDSPWGHPVFKVGDNKMFAGMSKRDDGVALTVKLTSEEREIALHFPHVSVARYVGRYGWVTAVVNDDDSLEKRARMAAGELLAQSAGSFARRRRKGLTAD